MPYLDFDIVGQETLKGPEIKQIAELRVNEIDEELRRFKEGASLEAIKLLQEMRRRWREIFRNS